MSDGPLVMGYWVGWFADGRTAAVYYANTDSSATVVNWSQRHGRFAVLRCRLWGLRNGYGWLRVGVGG
jgi:hypothetical protein